MDTISGAQPKEEQRKKYILWDEIVHYCEAIAYTIKQSNKRFNSIYGIPRGGLVPATILSHLLELPIVEGNGINQHTLIVDDIVDSGDTIQEFIMGFKATFRADPYVVAIFKRHNSLITPALFGENIETNDWLIFPWEAR